MKALAIDAGDGCVAPTPETITDGRYPFSPLAVPLREHDRRSREPGDRLVRRRLSERRGRRQIASAGYVTSRRRRRHRRRGTRRADEHRGAARMRSTAHGLTTLVPTNGPSSPSRTCAATAAGPQGEERRPVLFLLRARPVLISALIVWTLFQRGVGVRDRTRRRVGHRRARRRGDSPGWYPRTGRFDLPTILSAR
jgi:hypothetical protein